MSSTSWIQWKGQKSTGKGVHVIKLPPIVLAAERVKYETVAGRSGSLTILEGEDVYDDITLSCDCALSDLSRLNEVSAWLQGNGQLVVGNRVGGHYDARIANQIEIDKIIAARENRRFTVQFRANPFWFFDDVQDIVITAQGHQIDNPGNVASEPRIAVYGHGDVYVTCAGQMVRLKNLTDGIILDAALGDALSLDGVQLLNDHMSGDFMRFPVGRSTMAWGSVDENDNAGAVTKIVVTPRWRCR